jgi:hypothetical protein
MEEALCRIAFAFEQIANSLERIEAEGLNVNLSGLDNTCLNLQGPLLLQHEFPHDIPLGLLHVVPNARAFKVELSNCSDTETPFAIQTNG